MKTKRTAEFRHNGTTFILTVWNKEGEYYITKKGSPTDEVYDSDEFPKALIEETKMKTQIETNLAELVRKNKAAAAKQRQDCEQFTKKLVQEHIQDGHIVYVAKEGRELSFYTIPKEYGELDLIGRMTAVQPWHAASIKATAEHTVGVTHANLRTLP